MGIKKELISVFNASRAAKNQIKTSKKATIAGVKFFPLTTRTVLIVPKLTSTILAKNIFIQVNITLITFIFQLHLVLWLK